MMPRCWRRENEEEAEAEVEEVLELYAEVAIFR